MHVDAGSDLLEGCYDAVCYGAFCPAFVVNPAVPMKDVE